jgi:2'-5' RNA ligase
VLFYSVENGREELSALAESIEEELEPLGFKRERKGFKAHLTLARIKKRVPPDLIRKLESIPPLPRSASQRVGSFVLMKSRLYRSGAVYERIARFRL